MALASKANDWSGAWESRWRGGGAQLILEQDGDRVRGIYPVHEGTVEGRVEGKRLKGTWRDPSGFGDHSVRIEIFAFVATTDWNQFLAVREDIFLRLIDIVAESGTGFAFPSTVNYLARDGGIDDERRQRAEAAMEQLRQDNKLPFPEFDAGTREAYRDRLDYPPRGSATSPGGQAPEPEGS